MEYEARQIEEIIIVFFSRRTDDNGNPDRVVRLEPPDQLVHKEEEHHEQAAGGRRPVPVPLHHRVQPHLRGHRVRHGKLFSTSKHISFTYISAISQLLPEHCKTTYGPFLDLFHMAT